jgi:dephospho-CoA kinase
VKLIGLTGGIASGKSVVAKRLAEHGAIHIDADQLARDVVAPGMPALTAIAERFGPGVIADDGSLDRPALGAIIFADPEARLALNGITHPAVQDLAKQLFRQAEADNPDAIVIYDVPLLVEASRGGDYHAFDLIVVVVADAETRIRRLIELRGLTREEAVHRLNSQATDAERLAIAGAVIDSNGTLDETLTQADALWEKLGAL